MPCSTVPPSARAAPTTMPSTMRGSRIERSTTACRTLKIAAFAPTPRARVRIATTAYPGCLASDRNA